MTDQAIAVSDINQDLEAWGTRRDLREMAARIKTMLPNGSILEDHEALALAQASHLTGLNPFEGEIYFLKNPKTGESKGVYTGIKGRRRKAREQLYNQVGKGANFWIEYEFATAEWKTSNNYDPQATVCIATLRDTGMINEYVRIVTALVSARMSTADIKAIAGDRPFVTGIGFVKPGEYLIRPLREVAKKRAERAALAQRFDIGLKIKSDDYTDDTSDDSVSELDTAGPDWEKITEAQFAPVTANTLEIGKRQLGRDDGDLTSAIVDTRTGYVVGESDGKTARIYDDAKLVTDEQAAQASAEFTDAATKFDTTQPTETKPEDGGRKAFEDYCEQRNLPEFKRFALLNSAGGDYTTALEFAKKVK